MHSGGGGGGSSSKQIGSAENFGGHVPSSRITEAWALHDPPSSRRSLRRGAQAYQDWQDPRSQRRRQEAIQLNALYMHSPHPGAPPTTPYRPLSVVPQVPRTATARHNFSTSRSLLAGGSDIHFQARAEPVRWAEGAKRRARQEHEDAERDLAAIHDVFAVQVDVMLPEQRQQAIRRNIAAAKREAFTVRVEAERSRRAAEARAREEAAEAQKQAEAAAEAARLAAIPLVAETPVCALSAFVAEFDVELSFAEGEALSVLDVASPEGWLMARNAAGQQGLVPGTYVK